MIEDSLLQISAVDLSGLPAVYIFASLFFATFVSEDAACIAAGALAASGEISVTFAIAACFSGIVAGDFGLYWIGRVFGQRLVASRYGRRFVSAESLERASRWLDRRGAAAVFLSRFVTGLRLPTYLAAGSLRTDFSKFAFYFVLAAAVWTPILVGSVAVSGGLFSGSVIAASISVLILVRLATRLTNSKRRRIALGKLKRIRRWEFWPLAVFYIPVVLYVLLLGVRNRSLTIFTCANPAIPDSGFVGESKHEIYKLLSADATNQEFLLKHTVLNGSMHPHTRLSAAMDFIDRNELSFPLAIKPDAGERGKGVHVVTTSDELAAIISGSDRDLIIQEFAHGDEVSIFYSRHPDTVRGSIFSMTEKVLPTVTGDGVSTIEELILQDDRAVCLAESYLRENAERLSRVPLVGESVRIIDIGTHSRGAIFRDGSHLQTPELEQAIDGICRRIDGFYFGRFDIRYTSLAEFRRGRGFKIIELNGVTSESTNIYDPRFSLIDAYRTLFRQWRIAFDIGAANRRRGARKSSAIELGRSAVSAFLTGAA